MNILRQKKAQSQYKIRREHIQSYFKKRRLQIQQFNSQQLNKNQLEFTINELKDLQYMKAMLNKSLLYQGEILIQLRQYQLSSFMKEKSKFIINNGENKKGNMLIIKYVINLTSNLYEEKLKLQEKELLLDLTLPIIQFFLKSNFKNSKSSIFKTLGIEIFSFYMNSVMKHFYYFGEQDQIRIEYIFHALFLQLLKQCLANNQSKNVYQDMHQFLKVFFNCQEQDQNFVIDKLKRNVQFIMQIIFFHSQFIQQTNPQKVTKHSLHFGLFQFYRRLSYHFNQMIIIFNCAEQLQRLLKLIMFGFKSLDNRIIKQNCLISLTKLISFDLIEEQQINVLEKDRFFQIVLTQIQNSFGQNGLGLIIQLIKCYLQKKKFKKLIWQHFSKIIDLCRFKLQNFQDVQGVKASLQIICLLFTSGAQNLQPQINIFLIYFNSLNGQALLQDIYSQFQSKDEQIKQMIQIIQQKSTSIESSETIIQKLNIGYFDFKKDLNDYCLPFNK